MNVQDDEHDLTGAYVLGALTPEERDAFERHLAGCAACRAEVAELLPVIDALPLAVEPVEPPERLRDDILNAIRRAEAPPVRAMPEPRGARRFRLWPQLSAGLAAVAAILALGLWNLHLQQQVGQYRTALSYHQQVAAALASGATVSRIGGSGPAPTASAAIVQPRHHRPAYLVVQGLPPSQAHRVYELWLIRSAASAPAPAGTFRYQGAGAKIVHLPEATTGYTLAAVTDEPGPHGSTQPTGAKVLVGKVVS